MVTEKQLKALVKGRVIAVQKFKEYMGYRGVALCEMRDGSQRFLPSNVAHHSLDVGGKVVKILKEGSHWKEIEAIT